MSTMSDGDFSALVLYAREKWGLAITEKKRVIVENRIEALRRRVDVEDVASLIDGLRQTPRADIDLELFDVLSTNHTHFFREKEHLDLIKREILEPAKSAKAKGLRFWSAGCSKGCEPYSLSIYLHEVFGDPAEKDHRILATDLSKGVLAEARQGIYTGIELDGVDPTRKKRYFQALDQGGRQAYQIAPRLKSVISFGMLNLLERWPMKGPFDAILCRNVMIYFDDETRRELAARFLRLVKPGGFLILGTSESLSGYGLPVDPVIASAYRKRAGAL